MLQFCRDKGAWLAEILSPEENYSLWQQFKKNDSCYWIGLTDLAMEGQFVWQHSFKPLVWSNWQPGQPDNAYDADCVCAGWGDPDEFQWDDEPCTVGSAWQWLWLQLALCQFDYVS